MKRIVCLLVVLLVAFAQHGFSQIATNPLPGRTIVKMLPDYLRPRVYALNKGNGTTAGTLLALNPTNGATLEELPLSLHPTDMAMTSDGGSVLIINTGSRTISKVNLGTFAVISEKTITTPNTYDLANPLHIAVGASNRVYFTDGAWAPTITTFDYQSGTNVSQFQGPGAGGLAVNRDGRRLYMWRQFGWGAGYLDSWVTRFDSDGNGLSRMESSFTSARRDPFDTPILIDDSETKLFNKAQMFAATNVSILLNQFSENIYAISSNGAIAFGPTNVFNAVNNSVLSIFNSASTVQTLSPDQQQLLRYLPESSQIEVYDIAAVVPKTGPILVPSPSDESIAALAPTNLSWSLSPIALSYDIYLGTNIDEVSAATKDSSNFVGNCSTTNYPVGDLIVSTPYYWRVDVIGFNTTNTGPVWSFTISPVAVVPTELRVATIVGYNPPSTSLALTGLVSKSWTASVSDPDWMELGASNGVSPATLPISFRTSFLPVGLFTNYIQISADGLTVQLPIVADIRALNVTKLATDYKRPYVYGLQPPSTNGQKGLLLFINTTNDAIERALPIGTNPTDLTIHNVEDKLYIASYGENSTYVVDLRTQTLLPPLHLGTDIYKINGGKPDRIITEGPDQWIEIYIVNNVTGTNVGFLPRPQAAGDGETDPSGNFYYHCDSGSTSTFLHKYRLTNNTAVNFAVSSEESDGSRNLVMAPDGTRLFWMGSVYNADLSKLKHIDEEIYATTAHGDLALGERHAYDSRTGESVYTWPFATTVMAVSGDQQKVFLFNSEIKQLSSVPMADIADVPPPGINPTPKDGELVNLPLAQLSWTANPFAARYYVYFGTNQAQVASASTNAPQYIGATFGTTFAVPLALNPGKTYYWRVDSQWYSRTTTGSVWSFTPFTITTSPKQLSIQGVVGVPILPRTITLSGRTPTSWTSKGSETWFSFNATNGTTPSSLTFTFSTTNLPAGSYKSEISITTDQGTIRLPVTLQLFELSASKMVADKKRNYIYVLHRGSGPYEDSFLLFLNTDTQ